eukprot:6385297-Prymnesium_polylepis.1
MPLVKKQKQSTSRSDAALLIHLDQGNKHMECRRTATEHRFERVREADKAGCYTTVHNFYQLREAPTVVTFISCWQSNLQPPCRRNEKSIWTRADSSERRKYEEDIKKPEKLTRVEVKASLIWLQDLDSVRTNLRRDRLPRGHRTLNHV